MIIFSHQEYLSHHLSEVLLQATRGHSLWATEQHFFCGALSAFAFLSQTISLSQMAPWAL